MRVTSAFGHSTTALEVVDGIDLGGRRAIVTGGASGIGVETVRALAAAGASVTIAARSASAGAEVAAEVGGHVDVGVLDLADLGSVRSFAAAWLASHDRLDLLIENAGVMALPALERSPDGWELQLATNHLGHHLLAVLLAPALLAAAPARVVCLTSVGHKRSAFVPDDPHFERRPYDPWLAYGQSKTADSLLAMGLTTRLGEHGVHANAVHPGGIMTNLQRHLDPDLPRKLGWVDEHGNLNERFKTPAQGASTSVWAAVGPELEGVGGLYLEDCAEALPADDPSVEPSAGVEPWALDGGAADQLWTLAEATVPERLPV